MKERRKERGSVGGMGRVGGKQKGEKRRKINKEGRKERMRREEVSVEQGEPWAFSLCLVTSNSLHW